MPKPQKRALHCFRSCSGGGRLACSHYQDHSLENTADSCEASKPSRSPCIDIAYVGEWNSGDWRKAMSKRPGECGGMEAIWGRYGSCRGGPSHELYRRTNQTAIRQTPSQEWFLSDNASSTSLILCYRASSLHGFGTPRKAQEWRLECSMSESSCTWRTTSKGNHPFDVFQRSDREPWAEAWPSLAPAF